MTIAGEVPTKGNLVLVPADPDALVVDGGDPAGALHVTVKYIGDLDRWDDDAREMAQEALTAWAARLGPVKATVTDVGPLGDEGAMVLFLDAPELSAARPDLSEAIDSIAELFGADTTDKYPSYKPHLTVGYNVKAPEDMVGREVLFNTARAQWATGHVDAPLGAAVAALKPKRDGDGDGFVDDGTPMERPVIPGLDIDLDGNPVRPKGGNPQKVADTVAVKRNRVGNVDSDRLRRRRRRLIDEIDDDGQFYRGGRHGFAMRAAELTVIESELERRGELARKDRRTATILADPNPPTPKRTVYHLTDKAKFKLDPKKVPEDNALAIRQRDAAGLYVAKDSWGVESWVNGYGYLRPFVVELDVPEDVLTDERWGNEGFIPADRFDEVEVKRVIPVDAFARETYNDYGWVESQLGARFDNGAQVPERRFGEPYEGVPKGWRYEGPDARDMTSAEVKRLRDGAAAARRARASGKEASRNPFAERLDASGDSGSAVSGWDGAVWRVPDEFDVDQYGDQLDHWSREVPILPDRLLEWAARGANLGGLRNRDDNRLRNLRQLANDILSARRSGVPDDEMGDAHEKLWTWLTRRQDSRQALSRAIHDGPTAEERELYGIVHQHFLDYAERRWPRWGDVVPAQRASTEDGPFDPNHGWKKQAERPKGRGIGFTSWDAMDYDEPYGHELRSRRDRRGTTVWVGDVPKSQVLGRFGDTENELIVARDEATLRRLFGENPNPFTEVVGDPDVALGSGRGSDAPYPGMRPVTPDERKALRVEGRPIPPAWTDVYVATDPDAAMLARGLDRKGRHQYIYSAAHEARAAAAKYERTKAVAARVPALDAALQRDAMDDPTAAATALIRHFGLRPGSTADTKARKKAYGATTLQARHVRRYPDTMRTTLSFMGKSGQKITVSTRDPWIYNLMERWTAGKEGTAPLFDTSDGLVLLYVQRHLGEEFTTKDLRTLLANVMALDMVSSMRRPTTAAKFKAARNRIADAVAKALGNTRQVTLSNYIDPTVFAPWEGALPA